MEMLGESKFIPDFALIDIKTLNHCSIVLQRELFISPATWRMQNEQMCHKKTQTVIEWYTLDKVFRKVRICYRVLVNNKKFDIQAPLEPWKRPLLCIITTGTRRALKEAVAKHHCSILKMASVYLNWLAMWTWFLAIIYSFSTIFSFMIIKKCSVIVISKFVYYHNKNWTKKSTQTYHTTLLIV